MKRKPVYRVTLFDGTTEDVIIPYETEQNIFENKLNEMLWVLDEEGYDMFIPKGNIALIKNKRTSKGDETSE